MHIDTSQLDVIKSFVQALHATPHRIVYEFAGAGSLALWWLHSVGGSSRTVLEATDRYAPASLRDLIGISPEKAVSVSTGSAMARGAYARALALHHADLHLHQTSDPVIGLSCTASIATSHQKRGKHHAVVVAWQADGATSYQLELERGRRDRFGEEWLVSQLVLAALLRACGLEDKVELELAGDETVQEQLQPATEPLANLLSGIIQQITIEPDGTQRVEQPVQGALLSGSFNPLHTGHIEMAQAAEELLGLPVTFELPVVNADKGTLIAEEVTRRLQQFRGRRLVLSRAPLFVEKAALFPGCIFVMGYDTARRLVTPRYYGSEAAMRTALNRIRATGCRVLVAGRLQQEQFRTLTDVVIPAGFEDLFIELPEPRFRVDLSSTELRERAAHQSGRTS